jgi:VIT1/CCC1 family predicted Fe2+/Mn2+ transporter
MTCGFWGSSEADYRMWSRLTIACIIIFLIGSALLLFTMFFSLYGIGFLIAPIALVLLPIALLFLIRKKP